MEMKNDCERNYIKEAFDKLYNRVMPFVDLAQFADADTAFKELDRKVHSEIYTLKKRLAESDRAVDAGLTRSEVLQERISDLEEDNETLRSKLEKVDKENSELRNGNKALSAMCESRLSALFEARKNAEQYKKSFMAHYEESNRLRSVVDTLEKEINTLKKKIHELEEENIHKRPWHGDGNAMTGAWAYCKSLTEIIEELEAEKARLKEKKDLSYGHEFEFGDKVYVPWSTGPYMYIKPAMLYNPRTKLCVYVGKTQHLKWFGEKFSIV